MKLFIETMKYNITHRSNQEFLSSLMKIVFNVTFKHEQTERPMKVVFTNNVKHYICKKLLNKNKSST